jgi:hypothetical protein
MGEYERYINKSIKINPSGAISLATDYPLSIKNKGRTTAYLVGDQLFSKIVAYLEDVADKKAVYETDFSKGKKFEDLATELGL